MGINPSTRLMQLKRAVFLDRDGVVNAAIVRGGRPFPPAGLHELRILDGVVEAVRDLEAAGYVIVVVTNQPDIARGSQGSDVVDGLNRSIAERTGIGHFYVCPHDEADRCNCRKPRPGLLLRAASELQIDLSSSFMVGDRWRDVDAGKSAGVRTFFIYCGYSEKTPVGYDWKVACLREAADIIRSLPPKRSHLSYEAH